MPELADAESGAELFPAGDCELCFMSILMLFPWPADDVVIFVVESDVGVSGVSDAVGEEVTEMAWLCVLSSEGVRTSSVPSPSSNSMMPTP